MASFSSLQRLQSQPGSYILIIRRLGIQLFEFTSRPAMLTEVFVDTDPFISDCSLSRSSERSFLRRRTLVKVPHAVSSNPKCQVQLKTRPFRQFRRNLGAVVGVYCDENFAILVRLSRQSLVRAAADCLESFTGAGDAKRRNREYPECCRRRPIFRPGRHTPVTQPGHG